VSGYDNSRFINLGIDPDYCDGLEPEEPDEDDPPDLDVPLAEEEGAPTA
jgi:hypothetical protein